MDLSNYLIYKLLLLLVLVSPAILVHLAGETHGGDLRNELDLEREVSCQEGAIYKKDEESNRRIFLDNLLVTQFNDALELSEKSHSFDKLFLSRNKEELGNLKRDYALKRELKRNQEKQLKRERLTSKMLKSPRAKLYTGTNLTGNFVEYNFNFSSQNQGCHQLPRYSGQIKSIDTEGTCVRLFSNCICESWSQAFYPGIDGSSIDSKLGGVKCIGPCSSNELEGAEIRISAPQLTVEKLEEGVPNLMGDWWTLPGITAVTVPGLEHFQYVLGVGNNRLEGVHAYIRKSSLRNTTESERVRRAGQNYTDGRFQLDEDEEEVGFGIPLELGGPSDKAYNVFPQDKAGAIKYRQEFVPFITKHLQANSDTWVLLAVRFLYENSKAIKPIGMWYRMHQYAGHVVTYGYLFN